LSDHSSASSLDADADDVVRQSRNLASRLRASEIGPDGIRPAPEVSGLAIQLYNLINGKDRVNPNRSSHRHLSERWGREFFEAIRETHAALHAIMIGSGWIPRWTEDGWSLGPSGRAGPARNIPAELVERFDRAIDLLERVVTDSKRPPIVTIKTRVLEGSRVEELEVDPIGGAWYGEWFTEEEFTGRRMIARTSDGRWLGCNGGAQYQDGRYREPFDECEPLQASEWFTIRANGDLPVVLQEDIRNQLYITTIGKLSDRLLFLTLTYVNGTPGPREGGARTPDNVPADALRCTLEPCQEGGFKRLTNFAKEQFNSEIITWLVSCRIISRVCRVRRIPEHEARQLTLNETADAVEGSTALTCPNCGGPLDDSDAERWCSVCRTPKKVAPRNTQGVDPTSIPDDERDESAKKTGDDTPFITFDEAVALTAVSKSNLTKWADAGKIADNGEKGRRRKIDAASLARYVLSNRNKQGGDVS
jgi:hypothetical protein